jgi:hypothetical protein
VDPARDVVEDVVAGTRGVISFRNAFEVPRGVARPESSPTFLRVDLGQQQEEPSRWAVWDRYDFPGGKHSPRYRAWIEGSTTSEMYFVVP